MIAATLVSTYMNYCSKVCIERKRVIVRLCIIFFLSSFKTLFVICICVTIYIGLKYLTKESIIIIIFFKEKNIF